MKRSIVWLAALLLAVGTARAESSPAFWRVTDGAGHCLYLLGTVHMGREDMFPLGPAVEAAWQDSEVLAVEADAEALQANPLLAVRYALTLRYGGGDTAKNHLSPETYALGVEKLGQPEAALNRLRPMAWVSLAEAASGQRLGFSSDWGADAWLLKRARQENRPVEEIEGIEEQLAVIQRVPDAVCDRQIYDSLSDPEGTDQALSRMLDAWMRGDAEALAAWIEEEQNDDSQALAETFRAYHALVYGERDRLFTQKALAYLASGKTVFMAVGAAHVLGHGALLERLRQAGCTVETMGQ